MIAARNPNRGALSVDKLGHNMIQSRRDLPQNLQKKC